MSRVTTPYSRTASVEPSHLEETDYVRWGPKETMGDRSYQNARLKTPLRIVLTDQSVIEYSLNSYIRIYEGEGIKSTVHLISPHPLPTKD